MSLPKSGLVGKPSAGKSTFFNAACNFKDTSREAKMGAHPFTTIDPNIGEACFSVPPPECLESDSAAIREAEPSHGFAGDGHRRIPVTLKDVAGLVSGRKERGDVHVCMCVYERVRVILSVSGFFGLCVCVCVCVCV